MFSLFILLHRLTPFSFISFFGKSANRERGLDGAQSGTNDAKKQWASSRSHFSPAPRLAGSIISRRGWNF